MRQRACRCANKVQMSARSAPLFPRLKNCRGPFRPSRRKENAVCSALRMDKISTDVYYWVYSSDNCDGKFIQTPGKGWNGNAAFAVRENISLSPCVIPHKTT